MSLDVSKLVWSGSRAKGSERLLLLAIADFADTGGYAWPGIKKLRKMTGLSERSVQALIKSLVGRGELSIPQKGGGRNPNRYKVEVQRLRGDKDCTGEVGCGSTVKRVAPQHRKLRGSAVKPAAPNPSLNHQSTTKERVARSNTLPVPIAQILSVSPELAFDPSNLEGNLQRTLGAIEWKNNGVMWRMRLRSGEESAKALRDALEDFYAKTPDQRAKIGNRAAWLTDRYERIGTARRGTSK